MFKEEDEKLASLCMGSFTKFEPKKKWVMYQKVSRAHSHRRHAGPWRVACRDCARVQCLQPCCVCLAV